MQCNPETATLRCASRMLGGHDAPVAPIAVLGHERLHPGLILQRSPHGLGMLFPRFC